MNDDNRAGKLAGRNGQSNGDQGPELAPSAGDLLTAERLVGKRLAEVAAHGREGYVRERSKLA